MVLATPICNIGAVWGLDDELTRAMGLLRTPGTFVNYCISLYLCFYSSLSTAYLGCFLFFVFVLP